MMDARTDAGIDAGHLLLIGDPGAALGLASELARGPGSHLSVSEAGAARLDRLSAADGALMVVDMTLDLRDVMARLNAARAADGGEIDLAGSHDFGALVGRTVAEVERELILETLARCHGNRTTAATILGISVRTMRNKLKSFVRDGIAVSPAH